MPKRSIASSLVFVQFDRGEPMFTEPVEPYYNPAGRSLLEEAGYDFGLPYLLWQGPPGLSGRWELSFDPEVRLADLNLEITMPRVEILNESGAVVGRVDDEQGIAELQELDPEEATYGGDVPMGGRKKTKKAAGKMPRRAK